MTDQTVRAVIHGCLVEIGPREGSEGETCIVPMDAGYANPTDTYILGPDRQPVNDPEAMAYVLGIIFDHMIGTQVQRDFFQGVHVKGFFKDRKRRRAATDANKQKAELTLALAEEALRATIREFGGQDRAVILIRAYERFLKSVEHESSARKWSRRRFEDMVGTPK